MNEKKAKEEAVSILSPLNNSEYLETKAAKELQKAEQRNSEES